MPGTSGFLNPQKVLEQLEVKANWQVAHFGCGHGYFTIPLAKMVGQEGRIWAVDILQDALDEVSSKAEAAGLKNIENIRGNLEAPNGSRLKENSCDLALLANILFESQKKSEIIKEARRILKTGGKLVIIDWAKDGNLTSGSGWRVGPEEAQKMAESENFAFEKKFDAGDFHYGFMFRKF